MLKPQFISYKGSVLKVLHIEDNVFVHYSDFFKFDGKVYDDKFDAMYQNMLGELKLGKKLSNYKSSKYYKQYLERLEEENPEYLI